MARGDQDLQRAAAALAARLPDALEPLARLAYDYRWSWTPDGPEVFEAVDPERWAVTSFNPVRLLQEARWEVLERAAADEGLLERMRAVEATVRADRERPPAGPEVAYFSAEYGVHVSLPIYSGGLGALAGDFLKESSDKAVPLVAVGLLYRQGYFRQRLDASGWQHESWTDNDPARMPCARVTRDDGSPLIVTVPVGDREIAVQVWRVDVGRVPLFLLDADVPQNDLVSRWITARLYVGDTDARLAQYALLGAGGVRALGELGYDPDIVHLNEGHAAFAALELSARVGGLDQARERMVFTTHTPVPAGNDTFPAAQIVDTLGELAGMDGIGADGLVELGRTHPEQHDEPFGVTQFALRASRAAGGVSRRHGEVAREMWQPLWPDRAVDDVPIGHVTNGVHLPTWVGPSVRALLERHVGEDWPRAADDLDRWAEGVDRISDEELWAARNEQRAALVAWLRERSVGDRLQRGDVPEYVRAAHESLDPDAVTIGFARRVATYKRLHLLFQDPERVFRLLGSDRPIQVVLAGKAHPRDEEAKRVVQRLFELKHAREVAERVVWVDDYDLHVASHLVSGCDVWVNVPRPPLEASGTSGMKVVANGGLHLSVLDGWWAEAWDGGNGWALSGDVDPDAGAQDARDGGELLRVLEEEVVPSFHDRDDSGIPRAWLARVRQSFRVLPAQFSGGRMVDDYLKTLYATR